MNCHGSDQDHEVREHGADRPKFGIIGRYRHLLMMAACCGLPILVIALLPLLRGAGGGLYDKIARYSFLLCPLMMVPMMFMHRGGSVARSRHEGPGRDPAADREARRDSSEDL